MRRGLYFLAGTAAGAYATSKVRRAAESLTVDGLHDRLTGWFAGARVLGTEARAAMAAKEAELRFRLADPDADRLDGATLRALPVDTQTDQTRPGTPPELTDSTPVKRGDD